MKNKEKFLKELNKRLEKIKRVFDLEKILSIKMDKEYIQRCYRLNKIPYSLFHPSKNLDLMYMGISRDKKLKIEDFLEHANIVGKYIKDLNADKVLELAIGRGGGQLFLFIKKIPSGYVYGIDISIGQLCKAFKKAEKSNNYFPSFGDYHSLDQFENEEFDIVFIVEALCYSKDKNRVLVEVSRTLKRGGLFIIFDGYLNRGSKESLTEDESLAVDLTIRGMVIEAGDNYRDFIKMTEENNFEKIFEENVSLFILPTMEKFELMAKRFFRLPSFLISLLKTVFPKEIIYNVISAYLIVLLIKTGLVSYMITVLKKTK